MRSRVIFSLTACLLLAGCFDVKQDYTFRSDGTTTVDITVAIDATIVALAQNGSNKDFCNKDAFFHDNAPVQFTKSSSGGDVVCRITATEKTDKLMSEMAGATHKAGVDEPQSTQFSRTNDGYELVIDVPPLKQANKSDDNPMAKGIEALMLAKMAGRSLSWTVTAPKIVKTNGTISQDGHTASYSRNLAEAFSSNSPTHFEVTFSTEEPSFFSRLVKDFF